jgi:hypothetical protein
MLAFPEIQLSSPFSVLERLHLMLGDHGLLSEINQQAPSVSFFRLVLASWKRKSIRLGGARKLRYNPGAVRGACGGLTDVHNRV